MTDLYLKELKKISRTLKHIDVSLSTSNNLSLKEKEYKTNKVKALEHAYKLYKISPSIYTPSNLSLNIIPHHWNVNIPIGVIKDYIDNKNGSIGKN